MIGGNVMKKDLIRTALGYRCFLTIEEIEVTDPKDRKECKMFEELNDFTTIKKIASKYTDNKLFHETPYRDWETDRKSTRLNSSHRSLSRMPSSA